MDDQRIFQLAKIIAKSLRSSLTEAESAELEAWKDNSPEHHKMADEFSRHSFIERKFTAEKHCGKEKAYQRFQERQRRAYKRKRLRIIRYAVAAIATIVLTVGGVLLYRTDSGEMPTVAGQSLLSGSSKAVLTLADGQQVDLENAISTNSLSGQGVRVDTSAGKISYHATNRISEELVYNRLDVPRGGEYLLVLEDGTKVWLNSESSLRYPVTFKGKERRVFLKGEAYFEVAHNERMPFIVESGATETRVLGTSFNIRAYADEACVYATLEEGSIRFSSGEESVILKPDEQGRLDTQSGEMDKRQVDTKLHTGWREGRFVFKSQPLDEMMRTVARWYDVEVVFADDSLKHISFSGNIRRSDDFSHIVNMLEMTGELVFKIEGKTIYIDRE